MRAAYNVYNFMNIFNDDKKLSIIYTDVSSIFGSHFKMRSYCFHNREFFSRIVAIGEKVRIFFSSKIVKIRECV